MELKDGINDLPIMNYYDTQRFKQFSPQDAANWVLYEAPSGKKKVASYPAMGRRHVRVNNSNILVYDQEPRAIFRSLDYVYIVVGSVIHQIDHAYANKTLIPELFDSSKQLYFAYLPTVQTPTDILQPPYQAVFCMITDGTNIWVIKERSKDTLNVTIVRVTDTKRPPQPTAVAAFGNRFVVANLNSTEFRLTKINLGGIFEPDTCFTIDNKSVFAQESGIIKAFGVLQNKLYMFTDFTTGIWSNIPSLFDSGIAKTTFPWKKNTSYDWDYGIEDPLSLDVDFGRMTWLAQNKNGLITFMTSSGQLPESISTQAINVLLQGSIEGSSQSPYLINNADGFLYQYEDSVFYRVSARTANDLSQGTLQQSTNCLEFNFDTKTWHRCIEANGERNLIQKHVFFNNIHLVTVEGQRAIYEMAGNIYFNELQNPDLTITNIQDPLFFLAYPFRYENTGPIICQDDYSEFITDYVEIDFVWGDETFTNWTGPYANAVFIVGELSTEDNPIYMVTEDGNQFIIKEGTSTPVLDSEIYHEYFKPHIELYVSDDGGISFYSADVLEFSQLGVYQWRMRWYQLGPSRNRVYKLIAVSPSPIIILGGVMNIKRVSGGAN
jgi:hypothetical protein